MTWWIAGGVVAVALLVLIVAAGALLGSLGRLAGVLRTLTTRAVAAQQRLEPKVLALQARAEELQGPILAAQEKAAIIQARRGNRDDD